MDNIDEVEALPQTRGITTTKVPIEVWRKLRIHAIQRGMTMQTVVAEAIEQYLKSA